MCPTCKSLKILLTLQSLQIHRGEGLEWDTGKATLSVNYAQGRHLIPMVVRKRINPQVRDR